MAHYAKVLDGKVLKVIVADASFFNTFVDDSPGQWIQTSYNTRHNKHYDFSGQEFIDDYSKLEDGGTPLRGNFAGEGMNYNYVDDYFYDNRPYDDSGAVCESWVFNTTDCKWDPPTARPSDGKSYTWVESSKSWVERT